MTRFARSERVGLADALLAAGPDAPTLCAGWTAQDLAAHVVLRERDPIAAAGIVLKPLAGWTDQRQKRLARSGFAKLVDQLRHPPVWSSISNPLADEVFNLFEMYIHHEDVRRAQPDWRPRALDPALEQALWDRLRRIARLALRRFPAAVVLEWPEHGRSAAGAGGPEVSVSGRPGELTLFLTGRQEAAEVAVTGPEETVERLKRARLGI